MNSNNASELAQCLRHAAERVRIANAEGNPILSAWLPEADALLGTLPIDANTTPKRPFAIISVSLDEGPSYQAYSRGAVWNGWQCPYFSFDEGMKLTAHPCLNGFKYDAENDQFVFDDPEYADDPTYQADLFKPEIITVDGQQIKVYAIGAFSWCWHKTTRTIEVIDAEIEKLQAERAVLVRAHKDGLQLGQHDKVAVGVPGRLVTLDGRPLAGTYEVIHGKAGIATATRNQDGSLDFDYAGGTEVYWDGQRTVESSLGETVFLDDDGNLVHERQVKLVPVDSNEAADDKSST